MFMGLAVAGTAIYTGTKIARSISKNQSRLSEKKRRSGLINTLAPTSSQSTANVSLSGHSSPIFSAINRLKGNRETANLRSQQWQLLSTTGSPDGISQAERQANQKLMLSASSILFFALSKLWYPPLFLLGLGGVGMLIMFRFQNAYNAVFKKRRLTIDVVDSLWITGGLLSGYYFWVALACGVYFLGEKFLAKTEDTSRRSLANVFGDQPDFVWMLLDGKEIEVKTEMIQEGDQIVIGAGQVIPIDGKIIEGVVSIDQHKLTGEAQPAEKTIGDAVLASTVVLAGKAIVEAERTGEETAAAHIAQILNESANFKLSIQSQGEVMTNRAALPALVLSGIALMNVGTGGALALLGNYPGANLRLLSPMTLLNFLHVASEHGILVKDGRSLELLDKVDTVVFDKTGTLTLEQPQVYQIHCAGPYTEDELLHYAATAEHRQSHPIALAILDEAKKRGVSSEEIQDAQYEIGYGIKIRIGSTQPNATKNRFICVGSDRFMHMEQIAIPSSIQQEQERCHEVGHSLVMIAIDGEFAGAIEMQPTIRPEAYSVIQQLQERGLELYIISGDQEQPTRNLAQSVGIDNFFANTLPENKAMLIEQLQAEGRTVCFMGDGINDSLALSQADVSISLSGASTIATDTAQIVLMDANLDRFIDLLEIVQDLNNNMSRNVIISALPGLIGIGGVFLFHYGFLSSIVLYNLGLFGVL